MASVLERLLQALREQAAHEGALAFEAPPGARNQVTLGHLAALVLGLLQARDRRAQAAPQQAGGLPEHPIEALIKQRRV
jgi:hypothetical protein